MFCHKWFTILLFTLFCGVPFIYGQTYDQPYVPVPVDFFGNLMIAYNVSGFYGDVSVEGAFYAMVLENDTSVGTELYGYKTWQNLTAGNFSQASYNVAYTNGTFLTWDLELHDFCFFQVLAEVTCSGWNNTYDGEPTGMNSFSNHCLIQSGDPVVYGNSSSSFTANGLTLLEWSYYIAIGDYSSSWKLTFNQPLTNSFPTTDCSL